MNGIKAFFKSYGLHLALLALLMVLTVAGIGVMRNAVHKMMEEEQPLAEEDTTWNEEQEPVTNPVTDLPIEEEALQSSLPFLSSSSGQQSSGAESASGEASAAPEADADSSASQPTLPPSLWDNTPAQPFSGQELVYNSTLKDWRTHNGTDYTIALGSEVPAPRAGTVVNVYDDVLWGGVVEMSDSEGRLWKYAGLTDIQVKQDDKVQPGDVLGKAAVVPTESKQGGHIHVECTRDGTYLDPENPQ